MGSDILKACERMKGWRYWRCDFFLDFVISFWRVFESSQKAWFSTWLSLCKEFPKRNQRSYVFIQDVMPSSSWRNCKTSSCVYKLVIDTQYRQNSMMFEVVPLVAATSLCQEIRDHFINEVKANWNSLTQEGNHYLLRLLCFIKHEWSLRWQTLLRYQSVICVPKAFLGEMNRSTNH